MSGVFCPTEEVIVARRGPQPKNPAARQRRNAVSVVPGGRLDAPEPDRKWLKVTKDAWEAFWGSDQAGSVREKDLSALFRLFHLRNQHERMRRIVDKEPLIEGSQGQPVLNPAARLQTQLMSEIRQLEREFGLTPDAGARMVQSAASAERSVRDLMKAGDDADVINVVAVDSDTGS